MGIMVYSFFLGNAGFIPSTVSHPKVSLREGSRRECLQIWGKSAGGPLRMRFRVFRVFRVLGLRALGF